MRKILVFIGSRANYSSIRSVLKQIDKNSNLELQIIVGASAVLDRYGDINNIILKDGFKIKRKIFFLIEGETPLTMAKSTGLGLIEISSVLEELRPDIVLIIGDRFETMSLTIAAAYMNIPIAHTMGGEVSGTIDESIRHAITKFSHIHFPASLEASQRIERLGENKNNIFLVGCPRIDTVREILNKKSYNINKKLNKILKTTGVGDTIDIAKPFLIVSQHPVTTEFEKAELQILKTLKAIHKIKIQTIVLWPNADAGSGGLSRGIRKWRENNISFKMRFFKNLDLDTYIHLMNKTSCLIGNSSSGIREGSYIGTPTVNIGTRQLNRERGENVITCAHNMVSIYKSIKFQLRKGKYKSSNIYGDGLAAKKIAKVLATVNIKVQKRISY